MKKLLFIICIASAFVACKKKDTTPVTTTTPTATAFSFKVDGGSTITVDSAKAVLYTNSVSLLRTIDVYAFKGGATVIEMHFLPKTGAQTVSTSGNNAWLTYADATTYYDGGSGNFNLTTCDTVNKKIEGTFDFVGTSPSSTTKSISVGVIYVTKLKK
jgi:hypothetical protein